MNRSLAKLAEGENKVHSPFFLAFFFRREQAGLVKKITFSFAPVAARGCDHNLTV